MNYLKSTLENREFGLTARSATSRFSFAGSSLLNLISKSITSLKFLAHYVNCLRLHHQMRSEFDGFHSMRFSRCIHKIDHNS
jgi:hypothetical protein